MRFFRSTLPIATLLLLGTASAAHATARKTNSETNLPRNLHVGDVDGDGLQDFVQFGRNKIFAYKANDKRDGILHAYLPGEIDRLVLGDFTTSGREHGRDQVCAIMKNNTLRCYSSSNDNRTLWWWFAQPNFIQDSEQIVVGDFDGNGADDILLYKKTTGRIRVFTRRPGKAQFQLMPNVALGNLSTFDRKNKVLFAGDFGQATGRDDLMFWDKGTGRISRYDTVTSDGKVTWWWAFHTSNGFVKSGEVVRVANLTGGSRDGVALIDSLRKKYRFRTANFASGGLKATTNVIEGNLATIGNGFAPVFGHFAHWNNEAGNKRDDLALYRYTTNEILRLDARWDNKKKRHTYWSAWRRPAPKNNSGWPAMRKDKLMAVKCKFKGTTATPRTDTEYRARLTKTGQGKDGFYDYMWDVSYGMVEVDATVKSGWKTMNVTKNQFMAIDKRWKRVKKCFDTWSVNADPYKSRIAFLNMPSEVGAHGEWALFDTNRDHQNMLGHELLHTYGLRHAWDDRDNAYGDGYDIMGGIPNLSYTGTYERTGVGVNAYSLKRLGFLPGHRVRTLKQGNAKKTVTLRLAAVTRPESNGVMLVQIDLKNGDKVLIEFRDNKDWDRGFATPGVMIRRAGTHPDPENERETTFLVTKGQGPMFTKGEEFQDFGVSLKVMNTWNSIGSAEVKIIY